MCFNSAKSSSSSSNATTDSRTAADNSGTAIGAGANVNIDQSGFHTGDLNNVLTFLANYGQGLSDVTTKSLDTIKAAQVNNTSPTAGSIQSGISMLSQYAWPLATSLTAGVILYYFTRKK